MSLDIKEEIKRSNDKYEAWNKKFGSWIKLKKDFLDDREILDQIFRVRSQKSASSCPHCETAYRDFVRIKERPAYRCRCNRTKLYPLAGTPLEKCKIKLSTIVEIIYDMLNNKHGLPAWNRLRYYGMEEVTADKLLKRISNLMLIANENLKFTPGSIVEIDEVYTRYNTGFGKYIRLKRGKGSQRTHGVLVITERGGISRALIYDKNKRGEIKRIIKSLLKKEDGHIICTDENPEYNFLNSEQYIRLKVKHRDKEFAKGEIANDINVNVHVNSAEEINSKIQHTINYVHKGVYPEYLQLYISRIIFAENIKGKSFVEAFEMLINALPSFNERAKITYNVAKEVYMNDIKKAA